MKHTHPGKASLEVQIEIAEEISSMYVIPNNLRANVNWPNPLDLLLTDAPARGVAHDVLHVLDGVLDDLGLLDAAAALLEVGGRDEPGEVGQAVVHAVAAALLDHPVGHRVLERK